MRQRKQIKKMRKWKRKMQRESQRYNINGNNPKSLDSKNSKYGISSSREISQNQPHHQQKDSKAKKVTKTNKMLSTKNKCMDVTIKANLLLFGYLRKKSNDGELHIPRDVIDSICIKYYLQTMEYFKPFIGAKIDKDRNLFQVKQDDEDKSNVTFCVSQYGWNKGKHDMIIKILNHSYNEIVLSIGILTNPKHDKEFLDFWIFDDKQAGDSYQYFIAEYIDINLEKEVVCKILILWME